MINEYLFTSIIVSVKVSVSLLPGLEDKPVVPEGGRTAEHKCLDQQRNHFACRMVPHIGWLSQSGNLGPRHLDVAVDVPE